MRVLSTLALLLLGCSLPLRADDWPCLNGRPDRNPVSNEKNLPAVFSAKNVKWTAGSWKNTYSNPAISGGRLFIGSYFQLPGDPSAKENEEKGKDQDKGAFACFSLADGKLLWQVLHDNLPKSENNGYVDIGVCSSPAVAGERVYYVSNRVEVVCRSVVDGKLIWLVDMIKELGVQPLESTPCSPVVVDGRVFIVTGQARNTKSHLVRNPKAPSFLALDAASGKILWKDSSPGENILDGTWGSPAYGVVDGQAQALFPGGDGWLYSFEPADGKLLWKFNCKANEKPKADGKPETNNYVLGAPVLVGHRVLVTVGIDVDTFGDPGCVRAIDARKRGDITGTGELWRVEGKAFGKSSASVAVLDGLVYAIELNGFVNCFDLESGKLVWKHDLLANVWWQPLIADGKLYLRTGDGEVVVMKAGREKKVLAKNILPDLEYGMVVVSDGVLYIAGRNKLYAVAVGK